MQEFGVGIVFHDLGHLMESATSSQACAAQFQVAQCHAGANFEQRTIPVEPGASAEECMRVDGGGHT